MPSSDFLEKYPLYRKFKFKVYDFTQLEGIKKPAIHMYCDTCQSDQTFNMFNEYYEGYKYSNTLARGCSVTARYICSSCKKQFRFFYLHFDKAGENVMKVGQMPPVEISIDKNLEKSLGKYSDYYKKGLFSESQAYGIGAYAYFRRITEEIIDELLDSIGDLIEGSEKEKYQMALKRAKETTVTQDKIELVKDLLPISLRPGGMNPLGVLHGVLSEGLHGKSDEECLELGSSIKEILVYLVNQIIRSKEEAKKFTEGMKKLLEKKSKK
jgi:hypothetical protein